MIYHHLFGSNCQEGPDTGEAIIESGLACTTQCQAGVRCKQCLTIYIYIHPLLIDLIILIITMYVQVPSRRGCQKKAFPLAFGRFSMTHRPPTNSKHTFCKCSRIWKTSRAILNMQSFSIYRMVMSSSVFYHLLSDFSNCSLCVRFWLCLCCNRMASTSQTRCCDATQRREETQMSSCTL